jgi:hypothetical protein
MIVNEETLGNFHIHWEIIQYKFMLKLWILVNDFLSHVRFQNKGSILSVHERADGPLLSLQHTQFQNNTFSDL